MQIIRIPVIGPQTSDFGLPLRTNFKLLFNNQTLLTINPKDP